ncbi:hypothetical protein A2U01_0085492, partial [Trifolium medium]|nr:hypothetical protein [Trifolium medium]
MEKAAKSCKFFVCPGRQAVGARRQFLQQFSVFVLLPAQRANRAAHCA